MMRRRLAVVLAAVLAMSLVSALPAAAHDDDRGGTYLALGDSVAAGTQQPLPFTDNGYPNRLYRSLERWYGFDTFVNLACPGDDTYEMRNGDDDRNSVGGSACYGTGAPGGVSQLDAAVAYLAATDDVELITITIGANDILACEAAGYSEACLAGAFGGVASNLPVIIGTLAAAAPGVPIVAMNYYNPNLAYQLSDDPFLQAIAAASGQLTAAGNELLENVYGAVGVPVVDIESAFRTFDERGRIPVNLRAICYLTRMCEWERGSGYVLSDFDPTNEISPQPDIHPTNAGHRRIAWQFLLTIHRLDLLD